MVVAAGNAGVNADGDGRRWIRPSEFEGAIAISATAPYGIAYDPGADVDEPASYTNTGSSMIAFAAPGGDFDHPGGLWFRDMILSTGAQNSWYWSAGTSMASPHAAGVAALIIAENGGDMSPAQVEAEMRRRAVDLGKKGRDDYYGMGRISPGHCPRAYAPTEKVSGRSGTSRAGRSFLTASPLSRELSRSPLQRGAAHVRREHHICP